MNNNDFNKNNNSISLSKFVKHKLHHYKNELRKNLQEDGLSTTHYSAKNCPTLFEMFNFSEQQKLMQITFNILYNLENIQLLRDTVKTSSGLERIKILGLYKKILKNIIEIKDQYKLINPNIIGDITDHKSLYASIILLEIMEIINNINLKISQRSKALPVMLKLVPDIKNELPTLPDKINSLRVKIQEYNEVSQADPQKINKRTTWGERLNLRIIRWPIFRSKDKALDILTENDKID